MREPAISSHRAFVQIDSRKVHYRSVGNGPAILLIHGSPQSSRAVMPLANFLASKGFCVISPDTPGYGLSTPLNTEHQATTQDYAFALEKFVDAIGLKRFGIYGFHTGAAIACTFAAIYPDKVCALACDGLPAWTPAEQNDLKSNYIPQFSVKWDGSHLCWAWARIEEQVAFFPWYDVKDEARMSFDISSPAHIHANVMDLLESDDNYRHAYYAAFAFSVEHWLPKINMPHLFACVAKDPLGTHYQREVFQQSDTMLFNTLQEMWESFSHLMSKHPGDVLAKLKACEPDRTNLISAWVGENNKALAWRGNITTQTLSRPLVLLHDAGGSKAMFDPLLPLLARERSVIAFDLPGHGDSDRRSGVSLFNTIEDVAKEIAEACLLLGVSEYSVVGYDFGGLVAASMTNQGFTKQGACIGLKPIPDHLRTDWHERYAPDLSVQWDGAHLVRAFRIARWERLFYPWFERTQVSALQPIENLEPLSVHHKALNLLRAGESWQAAVKAFADFDLNEQQNLESKFNFYDIQQPNTSLEIHREETHHRFSLTADVLSWRALLTDI